MSVNKGSIIIQQCLHGYDRGHSLIESSIKLPKESTSLILRMSDASSIGYTESSPSYLTGYPLPEIGCYALARTWPAKNMPRPGCVWTHTLFIKFEDLALFNELGVIEQIFKRPDNKNFEFFNKTIKLNESIQSTSCEKGSMSLVRTILSALYLNSEPHIYLPTSPDSDSSVLSVWSKQWPKFRRNFKFRTYASKSSTLNEYFDLCFYDSSTNNYENIGNETSEQKTINILLDDIFNFSNDGLKEFLWRYGADSKGLRDSYIPLVRIYYDLTLLLNGNNVESFGYYISDILSYVRVSKSLEKYMFFLILKTEDFKFSEDVIDFVLRKIVDIKSTEINNYVKEFSRFVSKIPSVQANEFLFNKLNDGELSTSFICYLPNETLINLLKEHPDFIPQILISKPQLVLEGLLLEFLNNNSQLIKDISFEEDYILKGVIWKSIEFELWKVLLKLTRYQKRECMPYLLEALNNISQRERELVLKNVLLKNISFTKDILKESSNVSIELLSVLSNKLDIKEFSKEKLDPWLSALSTKKFSVETFPEDLALYLLIRGLKNIGSHPHILISVSFDTIHQLIATNRISSEGWCALNKLLPTNSFYFWDYWDRCKKLRNGLIEAYRKNKMPIESFIYMTNDKLTLKYLLIELEQGAANKYFLKDLLTYIVENKIDIEDDFSEVKLKQLNDLPPIL